MEEQLDIVGCSADFEEYYFMNFKVIKYCILLVAGVLTEYVMH